MSQRAGWLIKLAVVAALVVLLGGRWLAVATADSLWAEALGVGATHAQIRRGQTMLLLTAFLAAAVWCLGNLYLVYRSIGSVHVPRRLGNLEILEVVPRQYLLVAAAALGLILAIAFSHRAGGWWYARALAGFGAQLGVTDPVLDRDLGYYLFRLPWQRTVHTFVTVLGGTMLGLTTVLYAAVGAIRWGARRRLRVGDLARWHLAGLLAAFALALFWGYRLEPAEYVAGVHDVPVDSVLATVRIPVARMLSVGALVVAAASAFWMWSPRVAVVIVPWTLLAAASFTGHYVAPAFAGAARTPEELILPGVEDSRRAFLQTAFGAVPVESELPLRAPPEPLGLRRHAEELGRAVLWDAFAVTVGANRAEDQEPYHGFSAAQLDTYEAPDGSVVPVYVAAREVDLQAARGAGMELSWETVHTGPLSHAAGAVAVLANRISETGHPLFLDDPERPDRATPRIQELALTRPDIWFGPATVNFAVAPASDTPLAGVPAAGFWRRLALAWTLQSPRLATSGAVEDASLVLWRRDVVSRLESFAPFAEFGEPHAVVVGGALHWMANGFVSAGAFPLTARASWRRGTVRYLRSGLVGVVEASSGRTEVYLLREADPLSQAWAQIAPEVVRPASQMPPALARHVRYPAELFAVQLGLLRQAGLDGEPIGPVLPRIGLRPAGGAEPYWWVGAAPGDPEVRLRLMAALESGGSLAGLADGTLQGGRAAFALLRVAPDLELPGPARTVRLFNRLRAEPSGVQGALRMAPFEDGVLALQATYVSPDEGRAPPQLVDVALGWGAAVGSGQSLRSALARVETQSSPFGMAAGEKAEARRWFERMDAARRSGDWTAFGRAYEELRRILTTETDSVP